MDTYCRNLPHIVSVDIHHATLSRNSPSLLRINHLRTLWLNPSDLSHNSAICRLPLHTGYHSRTSDTELIAPTRQVRCTIVQGPNRKFRPATELCSRGVTWGYLKSTQGLLLAGVTPGNIVVCDRNRAQLNNISGWLPTWVRQASASWDWSPDQTEIAGYNPGHDPRVSGYNPGYYVDCPGYLLPWQSSANPSHTRSYVANFVTQVTKIITLSVLKDHQAAGVSLGLKNLCQGCINNANRAHPDVNTNYLQWFVPTVVSQPVIRNKVVLSIIDGVHGLWNAGPQGLPDFVWDHRTMYFGTDVVATDRIAWKAIDAQRLLAGLPPEESSGADPYDSWTIRQPQHITQAGLAGLGEYRDGNIDYRLITLA